ncbi:MAG: hypothetical protein QOD09_3555, partial [Bradyrhizobium sp.]|nr:hypothetical protein [Bradyrhizobium sp.]
GLEVAYSELPDMGVVRKHKTVSGLIDSPEVRLPMTPITAGLAGELDRRISHVKPVPYANQRVEEPVC